MKIVVKIRQVSYVWRVFGLILGITALIDALNPYSQTMDAETLPKLIFWKIAAFTLGVGCINEFKNFLVFAIRGYRLNIKAESISYKKGNEEKMVDFDTIQSIEFTRAKRSEGNYFTNRQKDKFLKDYELHELLIKCKDGKSSKFIYLIRMARANMFRVTSYRKNKFVRKFKKFERKELEFRNIHIVYPEKETTFSLGYYNSNRKK